MLKYTYKCRNIHTYRYIGKEIYGVPPNFRPSIQDRAIKESE